MKRRSIFVILLLTVFFGMKNSASASALDSLAARLKLALSDTSRVNTLNNLAWAMRAAGNYQGAIGTAGEARALAVKAAYKKGEGASYKVSGITYWQKGSLDIALGQLDTALQIFTSINDKEGIANANNNVGLVYKDKGDYASA